jgi:hypothetical protein
MADQGGISVVVFHVVSNGDGTITHYSHGHEPAFVAALPHLYAVCILDRRTEPPRVTAVVFVKTSFEHTQSGFAEAVYGAIGRLPNADALLGDKPGLLPARIGMPGDDPLSEEEFLRIAVGQILKFDAAGSA